MEKRIKPQTKSDKLERDIPVDIITIPENPTRGVIAQDAIHELASAIKENGQLQAIALIPRDDRFEIIFGHRRFLAILHLRQPTIRARIHDVTEAEMWAIRIVENDARLDVAPLEQARSYSELAKHGGLTQKEISAKIGRSEAYVSQRLAILKYPGILQAALGMGDINVSVAKQLAKIKDKAMLRMYLTTCIENGATPAVVERWVTDIRREAGPDGAELERIPDSFDPEAHVSPSAKCHWCDTPHPFSNMHNIWQCSMCAKNAIEALLQMAESKEGE